MISKSQALYTYHPETQYTCETCVFEKDLNGKDYCAFFGPGTTINEEIGSCGYYTHGDPDKAVDVPWLSLFTKTELGYGENRPGFSCKRCINFVVGKNACTKVDKNSEGDTPGEINPNACCSVWYRDPKRGGMGSPQLVQLLAKSPETKRPGLLDLARA